MLLGLYGNSLLKCLEEKELTSPVPHKQVSSLRTIYLSRLSLPKEGLMLLSDFGEARIGSGPRVDDIMPVNYRAPETLLYVGWGYPLDIWSVGLTVGILSTYLSCFWRLTTIGMGSTTAERTNYSAG